MKVSEYIASFLADQGVERVFTLTGGGAMFLNDAIAYEGRLKPVYCHHEQACAMAAEGYARIKGAPGVINVTTGPGGINALNGVYGAYMDSIPMLILSGQVKRATHLAATPVPGLRQLGDQEVDIVSMARPVCKEAISILDPAQAPAAIARAWALCQSGRPGPVWLDIPIDVQSAEIGSPVPVDPPFIREPGCLSRAALHFAAADILSQIQKSTRPLILMGTGARLSDQHANIARLAERLGVPIATGWTHDTIESSHPLFAGRPGTIGTRVGNFALQACDLLLVLGSRLNIRQTSYNFASFAKNAKIIQVDIDQAETQKPIVTPHQAVIADLRDLVPALLEASDTWAPHKSFAPWIEWINQRKKLYPLVSPHQRCVQNERVNPYYFLEELFKLSRDGDIVVTGNATACIVPFQIAPIRPRMRLFSNSGSASMGYDIPAAIGAAIANPNERVICLAGDGSAQLNIQELQTIFHYKLNVKVIILNNEGYLSIRSSQNNFFKRLAGEGPQSGVTFPDFCKVALAYGIPSVEVYGDGFAQQLATALETEGPMLISARLDGAQGFEPRMSSRQMPDGSIVSPSLEDMHPFLPPDELAAAMNTDSTQ